MTDALVEAVAKAMYLSQWEQHGGMHVVVPVEATEDILNAARDWSIAKYGSPIGNDAAIGAYRAMLAARPKLTGETG